MSDDEVRELTENYGRISGKMEGVERDIAEIKGDVKWVIRGVLGTLGALAIELLRGVV